MNGMIFAAGLGTRLAPLTLSKPKALVEVGGEPLLSRAINHLAQAGVDHIVVNVHHFANQVIDYVDTHRADWNAEIVISDESDLLLDTGGGLFKALPLFPDDGPIVIGNADVVCDAPLAQLIETHNLRGWDATLMTSPRNSTRHLLFDSGDRLCGWEDVKNGKHREARLAEVAYREAFNGFHVIEQRIIRSFFAAGDAVRPLPIINAYLDRADDFVIGRSPIPDGCYWFDVGTVEKLAVAEGFLSRQ